MYRIRIGDWTQIMMSEAEALGRELGKDIDPRKWYEIMDIYVNSAFEPIIVANVEGRLLHLDINGIGLVESKEKHEKRIQKAKKTIDK